MTDPNPNLRPEYFRLYDLASPLSAQGPLFPLMLTDNSDRQSYSASLACYSHILQVYPVARFSKPERFQSIRLSIDR